MSEFVDVDQHLDEYPLEVRDNIIFYGRTGSRAYGLEKADSDHDFKGIYAPPFEILHALDKPRDSIRVGDVVTHDGTTFELHKAFEQLMKGSPNMLELLWTPDVVRCSPEGSLLVENRQLFLTRSAVRRHLTWGFAQLQDARKFMEEEEPKARKRATHAARLVVVVIEILKNREVPVRMTEKQKIFVQDVADLPLSGIEMLLEPQYDRGFDAVEESTLPDQPSREDVNNLLLDLRSMTVFR